MRFSITQELVTRLRELQAESNRYYTDKIAESEDAVIMTLGMGGAMYLALDGRVIIHEEDLDTETEPREAEGPKEMYAAVVIGAKRRGAPELLSLLPSRPETAFDCEACKNRGWQRLGSAEVICWNCGGIGWTD
jgi:hypothetical protein